VPIRMHDNEIEVDEALVRHLLEAQLPGLAGLPLSMIEPWGTDNAIWRLGDDLVVRLPRIDWASEQVQHEATWLPRLAPRLPVAVPEPVASGEPGYGYPFRWAVHRWLPGEGASLSRMSDPAQFADELAAVVRALQAMPVNAAPAASNRARPLHEYNDSALRVDAYRFRRHLYYATSAIVMSIPSSNSDGDRYPSAFCIRLRL
jgi:aminoglycoside phosphotransferase (APT) family kinase protein